MTASSGGAESVRARVGELVAPDGTVLRLRSWTPGSGDGDAAGSDAPVVGRLVLVHGLGDHAGRYDDFARAAARRGLAVLAYDQRGHGRSDGRRGVVGAFGDYLDDLDRVVAHARRTLPGEGAPVVLGHSMGGLVVLRWLVTREPDVAGAVLSAPWLATAARIPWWKRAASAVLGRVAPKLTLASGIEADTLTRDPAMQRAFDEDPLVHDRVSAGLHRAATAAQEAVLADPVAGPRDARGHRIPLLFLVPEDDPLADPGVTREFAGNLDGPVSVELLEDGRHEPLNDVDRLDVYETVLDWTRARLAGEPRTGGRVS